MESFDQSHGSPYDRGAADSYYRRAPKPHKMNEMGYQVTNLTDQEIKAYYTGFYDNERAGDFKVW